MSESEALEKVEETVQDKGSESPLNTWIAIFVSIVATLMALCNVKDGNIVQAMQQAQAKSIDQWAFYQAKSTKQHIAENAAELLRAQKEVLSGVKPEALNRLNDKITAQEAMAKKYEKEKGEIRAKAEGAAKEYDELNFHDDQFDLADACFSVSIALAGVTALTKKKWLFGMAVALASIGFLFGLAGFLQLTWHSNIMSRVLG